MTSNGKERSGDPSTQGPIPIPTPSSPSAVTPSPAFSVLSYLSHILNVKSYDEVDIFGFTLVSIVWSTFAWAAWMIWNDGSCACDDWGRGHFGLRFSFVTVSARIGKWIGDLIGCLLDASWVGVLWVLAGAWWLHIVYVCLFVINNIFILPLFNFRAHLGRNASAATGTERFIVHALFHAILALLFHYALWNHTFPYPTVWGWVNYTKLDQPLLKYSVNASLIVGFILGACDITSVELIMLPITLPIRIIEHGKRMERERYESELARRNAGVNAEAKRAYYASCWGALVA
ncbi:hypothetical protein RQP46_008193 [Phenoliferia psychrophenolica]